MRRKKDLNPDLLSLADQADTFADAPPLLFGQGFAKKAKDHSEEVRNLRKAAPSSSKSFFRGGRPSRGETNNSTSKTDRPPMAETGSGRASETSPTTGAPNGAEGQGTKNYKPHSKCTSVYAINARKICKPCTGQSPIRDRRKANRCGQQYHCRQTTIACKQLEGHHPRQMGVEGHSGVRNRVCSNTTTSQPPNASSLL